MPGASGANPERRMMPERRAAERRRSRAPAPATEQAIEKLTAVVRQFLGARTPPAAEPQETPLTLSQAATRLGVSRSRTLLPAIAAGLVATIPWSRRRRITVAEIERLAREGIGGSKPRRRSARARLAGAPAQAVRLTYTQARSKP